MIVYVPQVRDDQTAATGHRMCLHKLYTLRASSLPAYTQRDQMRDRVQREPPTTIPRGVPSKSISLVLLFVSLTIGCRTDHNDKCVALAGLAGQENHHQAGYGYLTWSRADHSHYQCPAHITLPRTSTSPETLIRVSVSMPCITAMLMDASAYNLPAKTNPFDQPTASAGRQATTPSSPPPMLRIKLKTDHTFAQLDLTQNHDLHQLRATLAQAYPLKTPAQVFTQEFAWWQSDQLEVYKHCAAQDEQLNQLLAGATHLLAAGMTELKVRQQCFGLGTAPSFRVSVPSSELGTIKIMPHNQIVADSTSHGHATALEQFSTSLKTTQQNRGQTLAALHQSLAIQLTLGLASMLDHAVTLSTAQQLIVRPYLDHKSSSPALPAKTSEGLTSPQSGSLTPENLTTVFYANNPTISRLSHFSIQNSQPKAHEFGDLLIIDNVVYGSLMSQVERSYQLSSAPLASPPQTLDHSPPAGSSPISPSPLSMSSLQEDPSQRRILHAYQAIPTQVEAHANSARLITWLLPAPPANIGQQTAAGAPKLEQKDVKAPIESQEVTTQVEPIAEVQKEQESTQTTTTTTTTTPAANPYASHPNTSPEISDTTSNPTAAFDCT